jgi:tRNA dimethylallyltransferase
MTVRVVVIVGPTASGKTGLGVEVAHRLGSEIISVDSRQVYRGLDIGTGKDLSEYASVDPPVPYHLIDVAEPGEVYSLYRYQQDCYRVLGELATRQKFATSNVPVLMVGGSGLYAEAVIRDYRLADVEKNHELRDRLAGVDHAELVARLEGEAPALAGQTDTQSRRRVIRALEIAEHASRAPIRYGSPPSVPLRFEVFGVGVDRKELRMRIRRRLHGRLEEGMVEEVRDLLDRGLSPARLEQLGLEYREITAFLQGEKTREQMVSDLEHAIGRFAKRQETWFRGMERRGTPIRWIAPDDSASVLASCANSSSVGETPQLTDNG